MSISRKAILQITQEKIVPRPRWYFHLRNALLWIAGVGCILVGAIAFAVCLFSLREGDFHLLDHLHHSWIEFLFVLLPSFWIAWLLISTGIALWSIRSTKKGYRLKFWAVFTGIFCINLFVGTIFYFSGGADFLRESFAERPLQSLEDINKRVIWSQPEHGTLSGKIVAVVSQGEKTELSLQDFNDQIWQIKSEKPYIFPHLKLVPGETIRILGKKTAKNSFFASELHPWQGHMHHEKMHLRYME